MEKNGDPFQQAGAHTSYKWSYPSLPVIPPEVNGVWMVCFWGPVIPPHVWCLEA